MIFLAATEPEVTAVIYGSRFLLNPLTYPDIRLDHILAMEDELGRRILQQNNRRLNRVRFDADRLPGFPERLTKDTRVAPGSRILLIRGGGIGDVLMCTPAIRELRHRLPTGVHLTFATFKGLAPLFAANPHIDEVAAQPLTLGEVMRADYFVEFTDPNSTIETLHLTDFYLSNLHIDPSSVPDKRPVLSANGLLDKDIRRRIRTAGAAYAHTVYLNGLASDRLRDLPEEILAFFPESFPDTLFILNEAYAHRYPDARSQELNAANVLWLDTRESLHSYVTALQSCCALVTTDSSSYHIAAALDIPALALFGPIDADLRTRYYPGVHPVEARYRGSTCRSPCGKSIGSEFYPDKTPKTGKCPEAGVKHTRFSPCLGAFRKESLAGGLKKILLRCGCRGNRGKP